MTRPNIGKPIKAVYIGFDEKDPRWLGAWWAGFPIIATLLLFFAGYHI